MHSNRYPENKRHWQRGVVRRVLGPHIELALPSGGLLKAPNRGFEIGEEIAFTIDETSGKIKLTIPADIAEFRKMISAEPDETTEVAQTEDEEEETTYEEWEVTYGEYEYFGNRQKHAIDPHQGRDEDRDFAECWEDHGDDPSEDSIDPRAGMGFED